MAHLVVAALGLDNRIVSNGAPPSNLYQPPLIHQIRAYLLLGFEPTISRLGILAAQRGSSRRLGRSTSVDLALYRRYFLARLAEGRFF
jgi:hypothetical protein